MKLPVVIFSTVIRGTRKKNQPHGHLYLLNLANGKHERVLELSHDINLKGHGCERGFRGICFRDDEIYIGTYDKLLQLNDKFEIVNSFENYYLHSCHEICRRDNNIYLSVTYGNLILRFNLDKKEFTKGWKFPSPKTRCQVFNPREKNKSLLSKGPGHLNSVWSKDNQIFFSGKDMENVWALRPKGKELYATAPKGTHNIQVYENCLLMNWTKKNKVYLTKHDGTPIREWSVVKYDEATLRGNKDPKVARQRFARGLCVWGDYVIAGSAPATISVYHKDGSVVSSFQVSNNVRNAVHGLEVWPYATPEYIL